MSSLYMVWCNTITRHTGKKKTQVRLWVTIKCHISWTMLSWTDYSYTNWCPLIQHKSKKKTEVWLLNDHQISCCLEQTIAKWKLKWWLLSDHQICHTSWTMLSWTYYSYTNWCPHYTWCDAIQSHDTRGIKKTQEWLSDHYRATCLAWGQVPTG